jgi:8-oxo-dGTP pyrophosphatase MutT (NUDIX family)
MAKFKAAVAVVKLNNKYLLGLAKSKDDRNNTWCFPGGKIERGESIFKAAEREVFEETGIKCRATKIYELPMVKHVAFVACRVIVTPNLVANSEFSVLGFYNYQELRSLKLYHNVRNIIELVRHINV